MTKFWAILNQGCLQENPDFMALQELPRTSEGWAKAETHDRYSLLAHRHPEAWRGLGIVFRHDLYALQSKSCSHHAIWATFVHKASGRKVSIGSCHLDSGTPVYEFELQTEEVLKHRPTNSGPSILMGDFNVHFGWCSDDRSVAVPAGRGSKLQALQDQAMTRGLQLMPQINHDKPTFVSRKDHTKATQIDAVLASTVLPTGTLVLPDTRLMTGTDHEIIFSHMVDLSHTRQRKPRSQRGPREVVGNLTVPSRIDQPALEAMAARVTRRRTTVKFSLSPQAKRLAREARALRTAAAWKAYQHQVHREHVIWQQQRAARACRDWAQFRSHHRARKTQNHWAQGLTKSHDEDPFRSVISHFEGVFNAEGHAKDVSVIAALSESVEGVSARLTQEEVVAAVMRGKNNKSPGPDNVPVEFLKALVADPLGAARLTEFYQRVFDSAAPPAAWNEAIVTLLGKHDMPSKPADLRPIAVHSQVAKVFARILLSRVQEALAPSQPGQCACPGRQQTDYVWSMQRICQLALEWGESIMLVKVDISKAYDAIRRGKLATMLHRKLQDFPQECRCLLALLLPGRLSITTPWGDQDVPSVAGVKQGAVESPALFISAMEDILVQVVSEIPCRSWLDTGIHDVSYMDDAFLWDHHRDAVQQRLDRLVAVLAQWGLRLNSEKCLVLAWGSTRGRSLVLDGTHKEAVPADQTLTVMGIPLRPGISPQDIVTTLIARARTAFWANKELLQSTARLKDRIKLLQTTVWQAIAWVIGVVMPTQQTLQMLNSFQYQCIVTMTQLKRRPGEFFVDFQTRSKRLARCWLYAAQLSRWSTLHLSLVWRYSGHRARQMHFASASVAGVLTAFRTPEWWAQQQGLMSGERHKRRHFPRITLEERVLTQVTAGDWRQVAQDRAAWKGLEAQFVDMHDLPWCSGKQLALPLY